jgi:hypothetical protein
VSKTGDSAPYTFTVKECTSAGEWKEGATEWSFTVDARNDDGADTSDGWPDGATITITDSDQDSDSASSALKNGTYTAAGAV